MNKITNAIKWAFNNFFLIAIVIFIILYLRWFQIIPFVTPKYLTEAFVGGGILMSIYGGLLIIFLLAKHAILKFVLFMAVSTILFINSIYLFVFMPRVKFTAECNGIIYYIASVRPLGDDARRPFDVFSKWENIYKFESFQFGVVTNIVCDEKNKETHFINGYGVMSYSDGETPQSFYEYTSAQLKDNIFLMSEKSENCTQLPSDEEYSTCDTLAYTLYKCKTDYTNCTPLPITYRTNRYDTMYDLRANEKTSEISLFERDNENENETLIFTYAKNSHCYADGCTISSK
jgi:hypothetical protein